MLKCLFIKLECNPGSRYSEVDSNLSQTRFSSRGEAVLVPFFCEGWDDLDELSRDNLIPEYAACSHSLKLVGLSLAAIDCATTPHLARTLVHVWRSWGYN